MVPAGRKTLSWRAHGPVKATMRLEPELTPGMVLPTRLPRGFALDDYAVDGWVRDGSMAAIYRAHHITDGRCAGVKLQLPPTVRDPGVVERFEREAEVLQRVRGSAHVAELLDLGMLDDGRRYLVTKWLDGEDLDELLDVLPDQGHPLTVVRACRIAHDVALGLAALHEHGVVHLDLEPAHVVVGRGDDGVDEVMLVDLGHAADLRGALADVARDEALLGIPAYRAPERAQGGKPSVSCDIYALGVLLFEMISGACLPADGWSPETLPQVGALRHGVPAALAELVRMCMSREVEQRPTSARMVALVLDAIIDALEAGASHGHGRASARPPEALRTGDTLVGMVAPPVRSGRTERSRLPPLRRDEPPARSGDTVVPLVPPLSIDELRMRLQAERTEGTMQLLLATEVELRPEASESPVDPDDTEVALRLEPVLAEPAVDPDDTEVAMTLDPAVRDEPPVDPDDTAVMMVLEPERDEPRTLGAPVRGREPSHGEVQEQPWWLRWAVAAAVLLVLGGTGAWLVQRGDDHEAKATSTVTVRSMAASAVVAEAPTQRSPAASSRRDEEGSTSAFAGSESSKATEPQREAVKPAPQAPQAPEAPADGSPVADERARAAAANEAACADARGRAEAGKRKREWVEVLKATRRWGCWSSAELRVARARLRVMAFAELGELERCVAEGSKSRDREISARTALCREKLGGVETEVAPLEADAAPDHGLHRGSPTRQ
jgi:hypothetical protein